MSHVRDDLTALLDGALAAPRRAEVEAHLAGCPACAAERDRLAAALRALGALPPPPEPSPLFNVRLAARLAREPAPRAGLLQRLAGWRWRLVIPAGALAASAALGLAVRHHHRAQEEALAAHLDLMEEYEVVASLGDVDTAEDAAVVASLDQLGAEGRP